jgi:hypothetical protein
LGGGNDEGVLDPLVSDSAATPAKATIDAAAAAVAFVPLFTILNRSTLPG